MNQRLLIAANDRSPASVNSATLRVQREEQALRRVRNAVARFKRVSDGYLFGFLGVDALLAFIPFVGGLYTTGGGLWLLSQARQAEASFATKAKIAAIVAADIAVGAFPILGRAADIFVRSHAWAADLILAEIEGKMLVESGRPEQSMAPVGRRSNGPSQLRRLRQTCDATHRRCVLVLRRPSSAEINMLRTFSQHSAARDVCGGLGTPAWVQRHG
jgi:hypothetical protein